MAEPTAFVNFAADRTLIRPGETATIRWHVEGVKEVYFFAEGQDWQGRGVAGLAELQVSPNRTTRYLLRVVRRDDSVEVRGIEVSVQALSTSAHVQMFSVDKPEIQPGECATFRWHVEGVKAVYFCAAGENWQEHGVAGVAERQVCPSQTTPYRLRLVRPDDVVEEREITVKVQATVWAINRAFAVDRVLIRPGECVTFRWRVEGIREIYFYREDQPWQQHGVAGVAEQRLCLAATTTYCLRVVRLDNTLEIHYITVVVA